VTLVNVLDAVGCVTLMVVVPAGLIDIIPAVANPLAPNPPEPPRPQFQPPPPFQPLCPIMAQLLPPPQLIPLRGMNPPRWAMAWAGMNSTTTTPRKSRATFTRV
jgi:hypothetical protein